LIGDLLARRVVRQVITISGQTVFYISGGIVIAPHDPMGKRQVKSAWQVLQQTPDINRKMTIARISERGLMASFITGAFVPVCGGNVTPGP
jgi:hypothetical protein